MVTRPPIHVPAVWILLFALLLSGCSPLVLVNALVPDEGYAAETGIAYGPLERHKLDLYRPTVPAPSKTVVVYLYGGAWTSGARGHYRFAGEAFASLGHLTVVPDYRLYPEARFPAFVEDAALALAWVRDSIAGHGGDPDRIVLVGHSAGAHIAALLALDRRYLATAGVPARSIAGLVGLAGPYSFDPTRYRSTRKIFATAATADDARPVSFAHPGAPPTLLLHGSDDGTVKPSNSAEMAAALTAAGVEVRYEVLPEVGHTGILLALAAPLRDRATVLEEIAVFIKDLERDRAAVTN